jgi:hypothetical protein
MHGRSAHTAVLRDAAASGSGSGKGTVHSRGRSRVSRFRTNKQADIGTDRLFKGIAGMGRPKPVGARNPEPRVERAGCYGQGRQFGDSFALQLQVICPVERP